MSATRGAVLAVWVLVLAACGAWLYRGLAVTTDLTAFLPPSTSPAQRVLVAQLRDGVASRLMLIGLEGEAAPSLARTSQELARRLRDSGLFSYVNNGDPAALEKERSILFARRYLLSPAVSAERFSAAGLEAALKESLELLASPAGVLFRQVLPADPTGELRELLRLFAPEGGPEMRHRVWFSRDGARALLVAETRAPGLDVEAQRRAIVVVHDAFSASQPGTARLLLSGPGVIASQMRGQIESEAWWLAALAAALALGTLFAVYLSPGVVVASALPVVSGLVVGITVVGLGFGAVHGITLGFGATLIGEAVDYPSYLFTQAKSGERLEDTLARIGPTLRLAVLTTVFGALAMALSSFEGLAQLGVLTIAGVAAAGLTTRWVLPAVIPPAFIGRKVSGPPFDLSAAAGALRRARWPALALTVAALAVVGWRHDRLWDDDLASLGAVPEAAISLDRTLRGELGAPDPRYLIVVRAADREAALQKSETAAVWLRESVAAGWIAGFDVPSTYLPSRRTQESRRAALPEPGVLAGNLKAALRNLPFRDGLFAPFLEDVARARNGPLLEFDDLAGSAFALRVAALLINTEDGWTVLAPLRGVREPQRLADAARQGGYEFLDFKAESARLVGSYRGESLRLIALGLLCIVGLLAWSLRSITRAARVIAPVFAAVILDVALLLLLGKTLSLFHLVALLLVVGIGLNYALFFERPHADTAEHARTQLSLTVCGATTLSAFGCLALSETAVLHTIGVTVTLGCVLSLLLAAVLTGRGPPSPAGP